MCEFAEAYAQSLQQAAAPTEPVADPSKEELKAECEMLREELCYHRDYWAEWNMRALTAQAQKEELKAALRNLLDVTPRSYYSWQRDSEDLIRVAAANAERLLSGDGKE